MLPCSMGSLIPATEKIPCCNFTLRNKLAPHVNNNVYTPKTSRFLDVFSVFYASIYPREPFASELLEIIITGILSTLNL